MLSRIFSVRQRYALCSIAVLLLATPGCQTWQSSSVIPGMKTNKAERKILQQANQDPFPSPSDVGLGSTTK